ncbi:hypothetical protein HHK36_013742 [Tetracentron sinense]|uniref:WAT1-related protein n=1 Tax=Tetracentron sinense TaxID=13715 RepID=A0A835DHM6_TETSI|nr:hypothetical protein HHK36_013742 [Tetracentron sinense]
MYVDRGISNNSINAEELDKAFNLLPLEELEVQFMEESMGWLEDCMPVMAMVALQFTYAGVALSTRSALLHGMNPSVLVVYRQAIATLICCLDLDIGDDEITDVLGLIYSVTMNQNFYFKGLYLASSPIASAMTNLVPAITFLMAAFLGLEQVDIRSLRSIAKVVGTIICVGGAISMASLKGPKLLNTEFKPTISVLHSAEENWIMGCLILFGSSCCWSIWLILQVPISAIYANQLSSSAWICFLATLQSATVTFFLEQDPRVWRLHSGFELLCCFFAGIFGSSVAFCVQAWCISLRGPLFSAMFNPLNTVIVTIFGCSLLNEELYTGSLAGSLMVVIGLYIVLWGKAKDTNKININPRNDPGNTETISGAQSSENSCKIDVRKPLLAENLSDVN